jgi:hypothetical protein
MERSYVNPIFSYETKDEDAALARFAVISNLTVKPRGMISMDLAAENEFNGVDYSMQKQSSWANEATHISQSQIADVYVLPAMSSVEKECMRLWPKCWEVMVEVALMLNDPTIDWSFATRKPKQEDVPAATTERGSINNFPIAPGRGKRAAPEASGRGSKSSKGSKRSAKGAKGAKGKGSCSGQPTPRVAELGVTC